MGRLYRCLRAVVRAVTPRMTTTWEEPFSGNPSVFVCNHVGAFGPIDMVVKFPLRDEVRVWCNEGIMNRKTCPAYVRQDYWWKPGCRLEPLYTRRCRISPLPCCRRFSRARRPSPFTTTRG